MKLSLSSSSRLFSLLLALAPALACGQIAPDQGPPSGAGGAASQAGQAGQGGSAPQSPQGLVVPGDVRGIAVDAQAIYVIDVMGGVSRLDRATHALTTLAAAERGYVYPGGLVADDAYLYWTTLGLGDADGQLLRMAKTGGPTEVLAAGRRRPHQLAIDATRLFWVDEGASAGLPGDGAVASVPKAGGAVTELATAQPGAIALTLHGDDVYWANRPSGSLNGTVQRVAKSGGASVLLAGARETIGALAVSDAQIFWTEQPGMVGARIFALPLAGGAPTDVAGSAGAGAALGFAGGDLVFALRTEAGVSVVAKPPAAAAPQVVVSDTYPRAISFFVGEVGTGDASAEYLVDTWYDRDSGGPRSVIRIVDRATPTTTVTK
jgi:hypothetical protein